MEAPDKLYYGFNEQAHLEAYCLQKTKLCQIEYTRTDAFIEKACRCYCDDICEQRLCGMCFYKHDGQGQIKNTFKYNECNELKLLINGMKEK